jgi:hypothetical protein
MIENPLAKKLHIKPDKKIVILNSPDGFIKWLGKLPKGVEISEKISGTLGFALLFVKDIAELEKHAPKIIPALEEDGILWIAYPKKSSKVKTDISRDVGWDILNKRGYRIVSAVSIDDTWSALRFRPVDKVGK